MSRFGFHVYIQYYDPFSFPFLFFFLEGDGVEGANTRYTDEDLREVKR